MMCIVILVQFPWRLWNSVSRNYVLHCGYNIS